MSYHDGLRGLRVSALLCVGAMMGTSVLAQERDPVGACCALDGTCEITTELECIDICGGDLNCDWMVDFDDIDLFVEALNCPGGQGWQHGCPWITGDCDYDGDVDFDDINSFVDRIGMTCPPGMGNTWLGPGTTCDACPCEIVCYGVPEMEPCGESTNAGCGAMIPVFEPLQSGVRVCGTSWYDGSARDTDWYEIEVAHASIFTMTVQAEFPVFIGLVETVPPGSDDCADMTGILDPFAAGGQCEYTTIVTECLPPGTYWFHVSAQWETPFECPGPYWIEVIADACE